MNYVSFTSAGQRANDAGVMHAQLDRSKEQVDPPFARIAGGLSGRHQGAGGVTSVPTKQTVHDSGRLPQVPVAPSPRRWPP